MIFNSLINFVTGVASFIIALTPDMTSGDYANVSTMSGMFVQARGIFNWVNFFFPIDTLFLLIGLMIIIELVSFASKVARWIASILTLGIIK